MDDKKYLFNLEGETPFRDFREEVGVVGGVILS